MILLIDNNDSFSHNVLQMLRGVALQPIVIESSSTLTVGDVERFEHIVFSPGPGLPIDFPLMGEILEKYDREKSILGICLGHQAICQHYGGRLRNLDEVLHGVRSTINCEPDSLLFDAIDTMIVGRYHSWVADYVGVDLRVTATDGCGAIMAVEHRTKRVYGVQFHPESYITQGGEQIFRNFLNANH